MFVLNQKAKRAPGRPNDGKWILDGDAGVTMNALELKWHVRIWSNTGNQCDYTRNQLQLISKWLTAYEEEIGEKKQFYAQMACVT